jgi:pregnancy-associated plasma protein-A
MTRRTRRAFAALLVVAVAALASTVSPAAGGTSMPTATGADCGGADLFSGLRALQRTAAGGTLNREPPYRYPDADIPTGSEPKVSANFKATIPVYFHVITNGTEGRVTNRQIDAQIDVLNLAFAGFYGGTNTGFSFRLAAVDRTDNAKWFTMNDFADEIAAKQALHRGGLEALNVYTGTAAGNLGFAYFPKTAKQFPFIDGIVIHYGSVPGGSIANFNLGHTATHETGHWLGLWHTFDFGCQGQGDKVTDTPQMSVPTSGCPAGKDTCVKDPGLDPIHNFMDYSFDSCYEEFTPGQTERMKQQYVHYRS